MDGFAPLGNLFIENPGVGVVDDTLQKFAEGGKILGAEAVKHVALPCHGFWEAVAAVARHDVPLRRCIPVWRLVARSVCVWPSAGMQQQNVQFMQLIDDFLALIGHVSLHLYGHDV